MDSARAERLFGSPVKQLPPNYKSLKVPSIYLYNDGLIDSVIHLLCVSGIFFLPLEYHLFESGNNELSMMLITRRLIVWCVRCTIVAVHMNSFSDISLDTHNMTNDVFI